MASNAHARPVTCDTQRHPVVYEDARRLWALAGAQHNPQSPAMFTRHRGLSNITRWSPGQITGRTRYSKLLADLHRTTLCCTGSQSPLPPKQRLRQAWQGGLPPWATKRQVSGVSVHTTPVARGAINPAVWKGNGVPSREENAAFAPAKAVDIRRQQLQN